MKKILVTGHRGYIGQALDECKINMTQANKLKRMLDILVTL